MKRSDCRIVHYYYLDALRSLLMMLGVLYHAALIYSSIPWRVADAQNPFVFDALIKFNSYFRMPAFFIIAGFFAGMSLQRQGTARFLGNRATRILLPLLVASFTVNALMDPLNAWLASGRFEPVIPLIKRLPELFMQGKLTGHLWFLYYLYLYYLLYLALAAVARLFDVCDAKDLPFLKKLRLPSLINPTLVILPLAALWIVLMYYEITHRSIYFMRVFNTFEVYRTVQMFVFFLFGIWLFKSRTLYEAFIRVRWWHVALLALALILREELRFRFRMNALGITHAYLKGLAVWILCLFCFAASKRWLDRPSKFWAYMADASYTIYLFHQPFVVLLGTWLKRYAFSPYLKYPLMVGLTFASTLAIHHFVILRIPVFRLLYNGKWPRRKQSGAAASAIAVAPPPSEPEVAALKGMP